MLDLLLQILLSMAAVPIAIVAGILMVMAAVPIAAVAFRLFMRYIDFWYRVFRLDEWEPK